MTSADWPNVILEVSFPTDPLAAPIWTNLSSRLIDWSSTRGRPDVFSTFATGTATFNLDNRDGQLDPTNPSSIYAPNIIPWKRIRVRAEYPVGGGTIYPIFDGYVDSWDASYAGVGEEFMTVSASDAFYLLAQYTFAPLNGVPGESSRARIQRVLNATMTGLASSLEAGHSHITPDPTLNDTALSHIQQVERTEFGQCYMGADGVFIFENRYHRSQANDSVFIQANFGDSDDETSGELEYAALRPTFGDQQLWNAAEITDGTNMIFQFTDPAATSTDVLAWYRQSTIGDTPNEGYDQAAWIVLTSNVATLWVEIDVQPVYDPTNIWPATLGLDISELVSITRRPPSGNVISQGVFVEQITHTQTAGDWTISLTTSPQILTANNFAQLDLDFSLDASGVLGY